MLIRATRANYQPTLVNAAAFDALWRQFDPVRHVPVWEGDPRTGWFSWEGVSPDGPPAVLCTADVSLTRQGLRWGVEFTNGRHRTRWLMQEGLVRLPIGLTDDGLLIAVEMGLNPRRLPADEALPFAPKSSRW